MTTATQIIKNYEKMNEFYDRETMDLLLTRDWFVDDDTITELLDCANQDAWDWIYQNRSKYSTRIRMRIEPDDYAIPLDKLKIRVVDLTDKEWDRMKREDQKKREEMFEKDWIEHSKSIPDRPLGSIDSNLDDTWEDFCQAKETLTKYLETKPKKYVAPSARGKITIDPKQTQLENYIRSMENEYDKAQKLAEEEDAKYWKTKREEYHVIYMSKLQA